MYKFYVKNYKILLSEFKEDLKVQVDCKFFWVDI